MVINGSGFDPVVDAKTVSDLTQIHFFFTRMHYQLLHLNSG